MLIRNIVLGFVVVAVMGCQFNAQSQHPTATLDNTNLAQEPPIPDDFVDLATLIPDAIFDIRYFSANNFVGQPIDGYQAAKCYLQRDAAHALVAVQNTLRQQGLGLKIFDCYRPQRAVSHFMRWAADLSDIKTKSEYYPNLNKNSLVGEYIAEKSGHSRGATLDLTIVRLNSIGKQELDMGGAFDLFDATSNTDNPKVSAAHRQNRQVLKYVMNVAGFVNYDMEWWHYSFKPQPYPDTYFDFVVR